MHLGDLLNIAEFNHVMSKAGQKGIMIIIDKGGSLRTSEEYGRISLGPCSYNIGKLQYFPKISKTREIIYCTDGICNRRIYRIWRNMLYTE